MKFKTLGATNLKIAPLVLGGNVFGWTIDKQTSFAILDAFLEAGFNTIDTADVYNRFALEGGESETIIGEWMKDRNVRDRIILITKGGLDMGYGTPGLSRDYLNLACEKSLERLQTTYIDVYLSHLADPKVPIDETLETFQDLKDKGKIRFTGCSNYNLDQLTEALEAGGGEKARYEVFQPRYNLFDREYEGPVEDVCEGNQLGVITYYGLAAGFLTGKYRSLADVEGKARTRTVSTYVNARGLKLLETIDAVAARHQATPAQIALAWIMARKSVAAPIASATNLAQLSEILKSVEITLDAEDFSALDQHRETSTA